MLQEVVSTLGSQLPAEKQQFIITSLKSFFDNIEAYKKQEQECVVHDHTDKKGMEAARKLRLSIRENRLNTTKALKELRDKVKKEKELFDIEDKCYLKLSQMAEQGVEPIEEALSKKEKTLERWLEEQRKAKHQERMETLQSEGVVEYMVMFDWNKLPDLSDEEFKIVIANGKATKERIEEEQRKAEEERKEKERIGDWKRAARMMGCLVDSSDAVTCRGVHLGTVSELMSMEPEDFAQKVNEVIAQQVQASKATEEEAIPANLKSYPVIRSPLVQSEATPASASIEPVSIEPKPQPKVFTIGAGATGKEVSIWANYFAEMRRTLPESSRPDIRNGVISMIDKMQAWVDSKL